MSDLKVVEGGSTDQLGKFKVAVGVPTYDDRVNMGLVNAVYGASQRNLVGSLQFVSNSWLTRNFNRLFAQALNDRVKLGITHFLLWHEDIEIATRHWLDLMVDLMVKNQADVLSVIVPIKSMDGLTSTALDEPVGNENQRWRVKRLTMTEVFEKYPSTFSAPNLLLNTGVMLIDLSKPWVEQVHFEMEDDIQRDPTTGQFVPLGFPEDWGFSRKALALGAKLVATREVTVVHHGRWKFGNEKPWGSLKKDR